MSLGVATKLNQAGVATLLFDLLTEDELLKIASSGVLGIDNITREFRFNIRLLATRLIVVTDWILSDSLLKSMKIGYFGASTGAAAALIAAANRVSEVHAVVSQ